MGAQVSGVPEFQLGPKQIPSHRECAAAHSSYFHQYSFCLPTSYLSPLGVHQLQNNLIIGLDSSEAIIICES